MSLRIRSLGNPLWNFFRVGLAVRQPRRFNSSSSKDPKDQKDYNDEGNSLPSTNNNKKDHLLEKYSPDKSSKVGIPKGTIPSIDPELQSLLKKNKYKYNPEWNTKETSYDFPPPKSPQQLKEDEIKDKYKPKSKFKTFMPSLIVAGLASWGIFTYTYINNQTDPNLDKDGALLRQDKFLPYVISFKHQIDDDHFLIELTRKNRHTKLIHNERLFDGRTLWSIEIKQPDINIVRNYTPLPLYVAGADPHTKEPRLRLVSKSEEEGKFIIIVKKYQMGEFSRWLTNLSVLREVEIRGPKVEYKFPGHPLDRYTNRPQLANLLSKIEPDPEYPESLPKAENFVFYGAGTGIMPLLQMLYSVNPPKGFIEAYVSLHSESTLIDQFKTLNYFAEKIGRVKFHYLISDQGKKLNAKDVSRPTLPNFTGIADIKLSEEQYRQRLLLEKKEEVKRQIAQANSIHLTTIEQEKEDDDHIPKIDITKVKPENAFQQFNIFKRRKTTPDPSFAFVCGPDKYVTYVSGKPDLNNLEMVDNGKIGGLLEEKGWSLKNIKRLI